MCCEACLASVSKIDLPVSDRDQSHINNVIARTFNLYWLYTDNVSNMFKDLHTAGKSSLYNYTEVM